MEWETNHQVWAGIAGVLRRQVIRKSLSCVLTLRWVMNDALSLVGFDFVVGTDRIKRTHGGLLCLCDSLHKIIPA